MKRQVGVTKVLSEISDIGYGQQFAGWYDRIIPKDAHADYIAKRIAELHPAAGAGTLELGVGTGRIALPLSREVGHVVGVDSSLEMLAAFEAEANSTKADVSAVHGDMRTYRDSRTFGMVYSVCGSLSLLLTPAEHRLAFERAAELLIPGGIFVVEVFGRHAIAALHKGDRHISYFVPYSAPGSGLRTEAELDLEQNLWSCRHTLHDDDGTTRVGSDRVYLTTPEQVDTYAGNAGFGLENHYPSWDGAGELQDAALFISVYKRPAA
ncbi:class I SAM-dependent methyltransferase [Nonomuraea sp. NPDC005650]|uniref:class I SAM-dependent methyltransferase n=1 Tax=Nonomuraea sp. NPDC005650 TaxID=3157045 RepID=UPI0033AB3792